MWPAAGVALAGLLFGGLVAAPAVFVAAFCAFLVAGAEPHPATFAALAGGNTLAAAVGAWLLTRGRGPDPTRFATVRDAARFALLGGAVPAAIAASVGIVALHWDGALGARSAAHAWVAWFVGDLLGVLTVAPAALAWRGGAFAAIRGRRARAGLALGVASTVLVAAFVFGQEPPGWLLPWAIVAPLAWTTISYGVAGATATTLAVALVCISGTSAGLGPWAQYGAAQASVYVGQFVAITAVAALVLAVVASGRTAARALRESEARLRELADAIPQLVSVADEQGNPLYSNRRAAEYLGPAAGDGDAWAAHLHPDDRAPMRRRWEAARRAGEVVEAELRLADVAGRYRWFLTRVVPVTDDAGRIVRWYGTSTDIHAQKLAEARLRTLADAGERLALTLEPQAVLDAALDLLVPAHADWAFAWITRGTRAEDPALHAARHRDAALAPVVAALARDHAPLAAGAHPVARVLATGRPALAATTDPEGLQAGIASPAERLAWARLADGARLLLPLEARGRPLGVLAVGRGAVALDARPFDAADVEFATALARRCAVALDQGELHATARRALAELKLADRRKDEFLATLAHELRNPLAPIGNALEVLKRAERDPQVVAPARRMMERQLAQLVRLVDDLLDVARIATAKLALRLERVELGAVVRQALETARPQVEGGRHRLDVRLPDEPVWLDADAVRLAQVLVNLLNNAAKYTEPGGEIGLAVERPDATRVRVVVTDTGIGIPGDALPRVFEMFEQVDPRAGRAQGGLGIGLSLAQRIVELHGGTIEAHSAGPGRGSEFVVELPVAARAAVVAGAAGVAAVTVPRRVLVADDNRDAADSLALMLRLSGHDVTVAYDGGEALARLEHDDPDVLVLDIGMPVLDGYEVARRVRAGGGRPRLLVALTGWGQETDRRRAREAGFDHHFTKPVDPAAIEALLAGWRRAATPG